MSVIVIARGTMSATIKLGKYLADELNYRLVTREDVYEAGIKYGIKESGLGKISIVDQHPPSILYRFTEKRRQYLACFQTALMDFALKDNLIYIGHLAHLLLAEYRPVLRIRLAATLDYRARNLQEERGLSREEAIQLIQDIDERRLKWSQFLYNVDWRDPVLYDIVLNPEKLSLETTGKAIVQLAKSPDFQPTTQDIEVLKNIRLQSAVKVALWNSPTTRGSQVTIQADAAAGEIRVYGKAPTFGVETWEKELRKVISKVDGVKKIVVTPFLTQVVD